jgi:uncharacterized membrane protein YbjE (DUF340 family)
MSNFVSLLLLFAFLLLGMLSARIRAVAESPSIPLLENLVLYFLLFFMGFRLGRTIEGGRELLTVGYLAAGSAAAAAGGTALSVFLLFFFIRKIKKRRSSSGTPEERQGGDGPRPVAAAGEEQILEEEGRFAHIMEPLRLLSVVVLGFCGGFFLHIFPEFSAEMTTTVLLYILLVVVGIQLVRRRVNIRGVLLHTEVLLLPIATVIGTLAGGFLTAAVSGIAWNRCLALVSGFGWYSLSGVLISDLGDPVLGSAAFLSNMLRESISLICIPFLARSPYPSMGIGMAGATSMDVTLPLIERSCGAEAVPKAISHGALLSLFVPLLVPLFFGAGA